MVSFIFLVIGIFIVALGVFVGFISSLIQLVINFLDANILHIVLVLFGLFVLFVVVYTFILEPQETENKNKVEQEEDNEFNWQHSTAKAYTRDNTVSEREKSNKTVIDVESTVVPEQSESYNSYQNNSYQKKKTYRASANHSTKAKPVYKQPFCSTENKYPNKNSYSTPTSVYTDRRVNTETNFSTYRSTTYHSSFSEVRPELKRFKLSPPQTTIKSGETIQFKLSGLDQFNNPIKIRDRISWSTTVGKIDSTGLFSIDSQNDVVVTVTAKVGTLQVSSTVNVESIYELLEIPQLKSLEVLPDCIYLKPDEEQIFEVIGYDRYNNPMDCGEIIWSATGGTIDQNGKLLVRNYAKGIYQVTATSKHTPKYGVAAKTTLLTLGVSTRILSWAIANEEFFYDVLAPLLNLTNNDDSLSETDALVQKWILEIGRRRIAKLLKKASNLSFKEAFSNISDSVDYIVLPELRRIEFVDPPSNLKSGDRVQLNVIGIDQAGDRINIENQISWTATLGKINFRGFFIAYSEQNKQSIITARIGSKKTSVIVEITTNYELGKLYKIKIKTVPTIVDSGQSRQFRVIGFDRNNNKIHINKQVEWSATNGKIDSSGLFTAYSEKPFAIATILAVVDNLKDSYEVVIFNSQGIVKHTNR